MMTYSVHAQKPPSRRSSWLAACAFAVWLSVVPLASAQAVAEDPVVADVVRMLNAGVEAGLVQSWLESSGKQAGTLSADDMIALAAADAPAELVEALLSRSARPAPSTSTPVTPPAVPAASAPVTEQRPASSTQDAVVKDTRVSAVSDSDDCCLVGFSVEYRSSEDSDSDEMEANPPDLFVYLDGEFLGRFESQGDIGSRGPLTFRRQLAPGSHSIRLTREMHTPSKSRKKSGAWDHATTVSPSVIRFNVEPGANWNLDIRWTESVFSLKPPLHWRWSRDGVEVAGEKNAGAFRDDWPYLCDDIDTSLASGAISAWRAKDRSKNCVTWASLWPKNVTTSRAPLLDELRADQFKPNIGATGRIN